MGSTCSKWSTFRSLPSLTATQPLVVVQRTHLNIRITSLRSQRSVVCVEPHPVRPRLSLSRFTPGQRKVARRVWTTSGQHHDSNPGNTSNLHPHRHWDGARHAGWHQPLFDLHRLFCRTVCVLGSVYVVVLHLKSYKGTGW